MFLYFHPLFLNLAEALNLAVPLREKKNGEVPPVFFFTPPLNFAGEVRRGWRGLSNLPYKEERSSYISKICRRYTEIPLFKARSQECSLCAETSPTSPSLRRGSNPLKTKG